MELGKCNIEIKRVKDEQIKLYIITLLEMIFFGYVCEFFFIDSFLKRLFLHFCIQTTLNFWKRIHHLKKCKNHLLMKFCRIRFSYNTIILLIISIQQKYNLFTKWEILPSFVFLYRKYSGLYKKDMLTVFESFFFKVYLACPS